MLVGILADSVDFLFVRTVKGVAPVPARGVVWHVEGNDDVIVLWVSIALLFDLLLFLSLFLTKYAR